jgi:putative ABC transport system permease protein
MPHDLRFALRTIASQKWFSAAIVLTIALGIGVNTTVFTLVNAVLFKPMPFPGGDRLVTVRNDKLSENVGELAVSYPDFRDYRAQSSSFERLEAVSRDAATLSERGNPPERYNSANITPGTFAMLQANPIVGRGFADADGQPGAEPVVLIGYGIWSRRYGSDPAIVGRQVRVNGKPASVIGVMPRGFQFPNNQDLWMPLVPDAHSEKRGERQLMLIGILKPGVRIEDARADLGVIARRLAAAHSDTNKGIGVNVLTFNQRMNGGPIRLVFLLMQAAVGFVLMIACANVANMMLSRALARRREIAIRTAVGAARWQVVRQMLIESVLLSSAGGVLGLALTRYGVRAFALAVQDVGKPYWIDFSMDYAVFAYFAGICLLSGLLFGLAPALHASRVDLVASLKDGSVSAGSRGGRLSAALVALQFSLAMVLLAGAGLFVRGFLASQSVNSWLPVREILSARLSLPEDRYPDNEARLRFFDRLTQQLAALPGVRNVAVVSHLPGLGASERRVEIEGKPVTNASGAPLAASVTQSQGYFAAIGLPLALGRDFQEPDGLPGRESAIVTREFAARFWPGEQVIGKRFRFVAGEKPAPWISVIGVSGGIRQEADQEHPNPLVFLPYRQQPYSYVSLVIRTGGDTAALGSEVRATVQQLDQDLPLFDVRTLDQALERSRWYLRVFGTLFLVFAVLALVLASVGIYAVVAHSTSRRTQEIGVRIAMGATRLDILSHIVVGGLRQLLVGMALGLAAGLAATRLMKQLLFGISPSDPIVFVTITLLLGAVGLFACWLPAHRAAALDPIKALRYE